MSDEAPILTYLDCFSGLGAWTLAASWLGGIRTVAFVENDKRCQDFLAKAWPGIPIEPDIRTLDGNRYRGVDILTGGVPCQPASRAGKRRGAADDRWLWPATLRIVAEVRPGCCIFENPPGIADVGLDGILAALEAQGYEIAPIFDIPACAVNSPQLRHRYYIVAFATESGQQGANTKPGQDGCCAEYPQGDLADLRQRNGDQRRSAMPDSSAEGWPRKQVERLPANASFWSDYVWLPCADGKVRRAPGDSFGLVDGLHRSILGALGNSQVPQVAYEILRAVHRSLTESRHD